MLVIAPAFPDHRINNIMTTYSEMTVSLRRNRFLKAWEQFAPDATFAEMTLAEFKAKSEEPFKVRDVIEDARTKLRGLTLERNQADQVLNDDFILIAHGIRGDKAFGEDCPFYRALGFVPKSERKVGIRKTKAEAATPPPAANAA